MANSRSGSDKRQRTELVGLRMLPSEKAALKMVADREGHSTIQSWLRTIVETHLEGTADVDDPDGDRIARSNVIDFCARARIGSAPVSAG